jgi:hypothetical protein
MTELDLLCKTPYQEEGSRERYPVDAHAKKPQFGADPFPIMEWGHKTYCTMSRIFL